jgi:O-antigen ligase
MSHPTVTPEQKRARIISAAAALLAALALLAMGAVFTRQNALVRGLPVALPQPVTGGGARLGINIYLDPGDEEETVEVLRDIRETGIQTVKQPFYFTPDFDWNAADRLVEAIAAEGLELVPMLDGDPATSFAPPADPADFAAWAAAFATRYGDRVQAYIIWDEPNLASHWGGEATNPFEYAALLSATAEAVRAADSDAVIVAAPLAPTTEAGPRNLSDILFLKSLYENGAGAAFDVVAAKPYGFDASPQDRTADPDALNFSRAILLREVMEAYGDDHKAIWAGNWGWNALPDGWQGRPSIWGQTTDAQRATWTVQALERARREWPWMGLMALENWQPDAPADDPVWGFAVAGTETATALSRYLAGLDPSVAGPGFHLARPGDSSQTYDGGWRFAPEYGADISQSGDRVTFRFWGTDVGVRVRRADFRARLYATIDGLPANALPRDENGAALVLTAADPAEDYLSTEWIGRDLEPGIHTLVLVASRGWDQWALNGFSVGYAPPDNAYRWTMLILAASAAGLLALALHQARRAAWGSAFGRLSNAHGRLHDRGQLLLAGLAAALAGLAGWLTWGGQAEGIYRRLGDSGQLLATAAAATVFYVSPAFLVYAAALVVLFVLLTLRPAWGVALIALVIPFYVPPLPKPVGGYRFSPVEVFTLVTAAAWATHAAVRWARQREAGLVATRKSGLSALLRADWAVLAFVLAGSLSLAFALRRDVAATEWRVVIVEPALFYLLLRAVRLSRRELWVVLDAFVLGGLIVALYGLWQYATGQDLITAEAGLMRLRSIYGSPNNVALYLDRVVPLLAAVALFGLGSEGSRRRRLYAAALVPVGLALLLTFSKGGLLLGLPAALFIVFWQWQRHAGRRTWPWALAGLVTGIVMLVTAGRIPAIAARLDLFGPTGVFRLNLWRASLNMVREHPLFGVGLDNFLYAYRGRYILDAAWQEPNLNHPHNHILDLATRLGLVGLAAGLWLFVESIRAAVRAVGAADGTWLPVTVGLAGALAAVAAHGLVDHSFFLVDLAFSFYLILGVLVWISRNGATAAGGGAA